MGEAAAAGYFQSISGLYKRLHRIDGKTIKLSNPRYIPKPYEQMQYPGQRGQIDVKYFPSACLVGEAVEKSKENGGYDYRYTFIDEYSRFRYLEAFKKQNTYSSTIFLKHVVEKFPSRWATARWNAVIARTTKNSTPATSFIHSTILPHSSL